MLSRVFFVGERFRDAELPKDSSSFAGVSTSLGGMGPLPLSRAISCTSRQLSRCLFQDLDFFQGHSHSVSTQPDLTTLSSILLVPLAFSPCPDDNGGNDLLEIGSSKCSSLRLPQGELDVEWGIDKALGDEGLLDSH